MPATDAPTESLLRPLVEDLHARREKAKLGGGTEKIERQHAADKLTARERLDLLIDAGSFTELGIHGRPHFAQRAMDGKEAPADGVVTGYGKVDGRLVAVCAYDFTVMAGSMGDDRRAEGHPPARARAARSGSRSSGCSTRPARGSRRPPARCSPARATSSASRSSMSGVVPQVAAMMGPCAAGTAYIPGLADFVPMVKGRGSMALGGPAPRQGGDRRGHHRGGAGRLEDPHRRSPASATSR